MTCKEYIKSILGIGIVVMASLFVRCTPEGLATSNVLHKCLYCSGTGKDFKRIKILPFLSWVWGDCKSCSGEGQSALVKEKCFKTEDDKVEDEREVSNTSPTFDVDEPGEIEEAVRQTTHEVICTICQGAQWCTLCIGTGRCPPCGGGGVLYLYGELTDCGSCGGDGRCGYCEGRGYCPACEGKGMQLLEY